MEKKHTNYKNTLINSQNLQSNKSATNKQFIKRIISNILIEINTLICNSSTSGRPNCEYILPQIQQGIIYFDNITNIENIKTYIYGKIIHKLTKCEYDVKYSHKNRKIIISWIEQDTNLNINKYQSILSNYK